jgi:general secretion pathway protein A
MEYLKFYGLGAEPFLNNAEVGFYFESRGQRRARLRILRAIQQRRGLCVVVGEAGCGKTTLATHLAASLDPKHFATRMRVIPHAECATGWVLPQIARTLDTPEPGVDPARLIERIGQSLIMARATGRHPVLILDEAQFLASPLAMQEFRALLNLLQDGQPLLSIALFGLTELAEVLRLDPPLAQRVDARAELGPLDPDEISLYIAHRLHCADGPTNLFAPEAVELLGRLARGVPRLINTLADNALFEGSLTESRPVGTDAVWAAAEQLGMMGEEESAPKIPEVPLMVEAAAEATPQASVAPAVAAPVTPKPVAAPAPKAVARTAPSPAPVHVAPPTPVASAPAAVAASPVRTAVANVPAPTSRPDPPARVAPPAPAIIAEPAIEPDVEESEQPGDADEDFFAGLIAEPEPAPELEAEPEAAEIMLETEAAMILEEPAAEAAPPPSEPQAAADDLLDMAEFIELDPEPATPSRPAAKPKPAAAPAPPAPAAAAPPASEDGELDDLFEQIQLGE